MSRSRIITGEEYEQLLAEIRELKKRLGEIEEALLPLRLLAEHLPHLMADIQVFKASAPIISMLNIMDNTDLNALGIAMMGGMSCSGEALRKIGEEGAPKIGLLGMMKAMRDPDVQKGLGLMLALLKQMGPCMEKNLRMLKTE